MIGLDIDRLTSSYVWQRGSGSPTWKMLTSLFEQGTISAKELLLSTHGVTAIAKRVSFDLEHTAVQETYGSQEYDRSPAENNISSDRSARLEMLQELRHFCEEEMVLHPESKTSAVHGYLHGDMSAHWEHIETTLERCNSVPDDAAIDAQDPVIAESVLLYQHSFMCVSYV